MKVIKWHVRNKQKPEGWIAKENVADDIVEFLSDYHKNIHTVDIPQDKHNAIDNDAYTLSTAYLSEVCLELFIKSHFFVLQNTAKVYPHIEYVYY